MNDAATTATDTLTDTMIRALRDEAGAAGDTLMVKACSMALEGDKECRENCADIITARRAMEDVALVVVVAE